jgi:hypothetical protein
VKISFRNDRRGRERRRKNGQNNRHRKRHRSRGWINKSDDNVRIHKSKTVIVDPRMESIQATTTFECTSRRQSSWILSSLLQKAPRPTNLSISNNINKHENSQLELYPSPRSKTKSPAATNTIERRHRSFPTQNGLAFARGDINLPPPQQMMKQED